MHENGVWKRGHICQQCWANGDELSPESPFESDRKKTQATDIAQAVIYTVTQPNDVNRVNDPFQ